jgi:hypothetical protein
LRREKDTRNQGCAGLLALQGDRQPARVGGAGGQRRDIRSSGNADGTAGNCRGLGQDLGHAHDQ